MSLPTMRNNNVENSAKLTTSNPGPSSNKYTNKECRLCSNVGHLSNNCPDGPCIMAERKNWGNSKGVYNSKTLKSITTKGAKASYTHPADPIYSWKSAYIQNQGAASDNTTNAYSNVTNSNRRPVLISV